MLKRIKDVVVLEILQLYRYNNNQILHVSMFYDTFWTYAELHGEPFCDAAVLCEAE